MLIALAEIPAQRPHGRGVQRQESGLAELALTQEQGAVTQIEVAAIQT